MQPLIAAVLMLQLVCACAGQLQRKPHIIIIMADDMGFNDVGFHGSDQIPTPNIDALAAFGVSLNRYYVQPLCTPSRASLMTGKYPSHVGMQHGVIISEEPWGLGLDQKLLPEYMREAGYRTHLVGKWHLGHYMKRYTPTLRGFDSHVGYLAGLIDYYNHSLTREIQFYVKDKRKDTVKVNKSNIGYISTHIPPTLEASIGGFIMDSGYDMRHNLTTHYDTKGMYATDMFTEAAVRTITEHPLHEPLFMYLAHLAPHTANDYDPMQVPEDELARMAHIADPTRRRYAAMVSRMDTGIGRVVDALRLRGMLDNSVILFFADNGAPIKGVYSNAGSNYPFRGQKNSPWEGAVRSAAAIWSPILQKRQRVSQQLFHISDWLPTFAHLAGVDVQGPIDGQNIWPALSWNLTSPRSELLSSMDNIAGFSSLVRHNWKIVNDSVLNSVSHENWLSGTEKPLSGTEQHESYGAYGDAVRQSLTGQALLPYSFGFEQGHSVPMTSAQIKSLRSEAVVGWNGVPLPADGEPAQCKPQEAPCIFDIVEDPCERRNLASVRPDVLADMLKALHKMERSAVKPRNRPGEERSDPKYYNGTWTWWYDELGLPDHSSGPANISSGSCTWLFSIVTLLVLYSF